VTQISHTDGRRTVGGGYPARIRALGETLIRGLVLNNDGRRSTIMRKAFFDAAKVATPSIAVHRNGIWYYVDTRDHVVGRATFAEGSYESDVMADALGILAAHGHSLQGRTFVDVGANIGTSTITALTSFGARDAIAIEPAPSNYRLLRCNVIANDLEERVRTVWGGASAEPGVGALTLSSWNSGDHRLNLGNGQDAATTAGERSVEVPVVRLDDILSGHGVDHGEVGLVWLDTQGHEGFVLAGAPALMASGVPVITEYWPHGLRGSDGLELFHSLVEENYDVVVDVREAADTTGRGTISARAVRELEARYSGSSFTDLVLLKGG
jgi:FkbM family methyltransferase